MFAGGTRFAQSAGEKRQIKNTRGNAMNMLDPWMTDRKPRLSRMLISIHGMSSARCVSSVASALGLIGGVSSVEVSLPGRAEVEFDPAKADPAQFRTAVRVVGFEPEFAEEIQAAA